MMKRTLVVVLGALLAACSAEDDHKGGDSHSHEGDHSHAEAHPHEGPNGGHVLEVGDHVAHLEVLHDEGAGKMTIHVLGPDVKTPMTVAKAPQLKISTDDGPKVIATAAQGESGSVFTATDPALKGHTHGRVSIEINGKIYNPELEHDDDH